MTMNNIMGNIAEELRNISGEENVIVNAPMSRYTSFKAGGCARILAEPGNEDELKQMIKLLHSASCRYMVMGNGTDILVRDEGYDGVIIRIGQAFKYVSINGTRLECGCGTPLSYIARAAADNSLTGFEFASGIPGSMGGALFMNAGAYGGEIKDILESAVIVSDDGRDVYTVSAEEMNMGYRHSVLQSGGIAIRATIRLKEGNTDEINKTMAELTARRNAKQPVNFPSAGSFFKRPEGYFAGKLIQDAGCKGLSVGDAEVSTLHSGFIINKGSASATDIIRLMQIVQERVKDKFGVILEPEVRII